jgi:hypothetical protein
MSTVIVRNGDTIGKDPSDSKVYAFDWDTDNLATSVTIATSVWKILAVGVVGSSISQSITSITRVTTTATVTTAAAHGFATDDYVTISGATAAAGAISQFNGTFAITVTSTTTFTYTVLNSGATSASGTLVVATGIDQVSILSAAPYSSRYTQFRFTGGTLGAVYEIANMILTNESPAQRKERSFRILIEQQ